MNGEDTFICQCNILKLPGRWEDVTSGGVLIINVKYLQNSIKPEPKGFVVTSGLLINLKKECV